MPNFYCAAPWRGLHVNPRGDVKTCCAGDPNTLGNLNERSIEQILHGPIMQEIRQTLRQGRAHQQYCQNCIQAERYGRSERDWHNQLNRDFDCSQASDIEHVPVLVDVRWNITCHLSCNYCNDSSSSKWAAFNGFPVKSGVRPYYESVCDYLEKHHDHIREVALVGGEPLLLPENERLLDVIPKECTVTLITNASVGNLEHNTLFKKLSQRRHVGWSISFDNIEQRFEYVRHGASWTTLLHNLDLIQELMANHGHYGGIHAVYNIYSATRIHELYEFSRSRGLTIHWQSLFEPRFLDPLQLGQQIRNLALEHLQSILDKTDLTKDENLFLQQAKINNEKHLDSQSLIQQFKQHIDKIENTYHQNQKEQFVKLWPEINNFL